MRMHGRRFCAAIGAAVPLLAAALVATGACARDEGPRRSYLLPIESVGWARATDSTRLTVAYRLDTCDELERLEAAVSADSVHVRVYGRQGAFCGSARVETADTVVPFGMSATFTVVAHEPDGSARLFPVYRVAERPCPGPSFGIPNWNPQLVVGTEAELRVYACPLLFPRPLQLSWRVADTTIATVTASSDSTALLRAKAPGRTQLTLREARSAEAGMALEVVAPAK